MVKQLITSARDWYGRYERPISSVSLITGFIFEWFTLKHIDKFWENIWVAAHFFVIAVLMVLVNSHENLGMDHKDASKMHFWYLTFLQGFFGGLLSTFLVFYSRSATLGVSWPFLLILASAFIANESFKKNYERLIFQICLFYLNLLVFTIYIVPVLAGRIGQDIFLLSGIISLVSILIFIIAVGFFAKEKFKKRRKVLALAIFGIYVSTNALYFLNIIPPIPLSLTDTGVFHSLTRTAEGKYIVTAETADGWRNFFTVSEKLHLTPGSPAYAYSAIYSPALFNTQIIHEWQKYDDKRGWITQSRIFLTAGGGNKRGYRTYSLKNNVTPGKWRVNVETVRGQVIGRLRFDVIAAQAAPALETLVK